MNFEVVEFQRLHERQSEFLKKGAEWLDSNVENKAISDDIYISAESRFKMWLEYASACQAAVASLIDLVELERASALRREVEGLRRRVALMERQARSAGLDPSLVFWAGSGPPY